MSVKKYKIQHGKIIICLQNDMKKNQHGKIICLQNEINISTAKLYVYKMR